MDGLWILVLVGIFVLWCRAQYLSFVGVVPSSMSKKIARLSVPWLLGASLRFQIEVLDLEGTDYLGIPTVELFGWFSKALLLAFGVSIFLQGIFFFYWAPRRFEKERSEKSGQEPQSSLTEASDSRQEGCA